jgi:hypothetical protein
MKKISLLSFYLLCVSILSAAPMQGNYTIDSTAASSASNFKSWRDFSLSLNTNGISGNVLVQVLSNTLETAQVTFGPITGSSSSSQIKIKGNGYRVSANVADASILLYGTDYLTIDSATIENTSNNPNAMGLRFFNAADHNTISNCTILLTGLTLRTVNNGAYISFSSVIDKPAVASSSNLGSYNLIVGNTLSTKNNSPGPAYGISINGSYSSYTTTPQNNTVIGNRILNFAYMGIYMSYVNGNQIISNNISRTATDTSYCSNTLFGIYLLHGVSGNRSIRIDSNYLHEFPIDTNKTGVIPATIYGIYSYSIFGNDSLHFSVSGNLVSKLKASSTLNIHYHDGAQYIDLIGNTVYKATLPIGSGNGRTFNGINLIYAKGSYRINKNTIQYCDGGYTWYGIKNETPLFCSGVQEINDNYIHHNIKNYYYRYGIYSAYANYSDSAHPVEIKRNRITHNQTDNYYTYLIYTSYYGTYQINDNLLAYNKSDYYYLFGIYTNYYGYYTIARNKIHHNTAINNVGFFCGIYNIDNYETKIFSNLMYGNVGYYGTYGISNTCNSSNPTNMLVQQNTIIIDGNDSKNTMHNAYPISVSTLNSSKTFFIGNIYDVRNSANAYFNYVNTGTLFSGHNSYCIDNNTKVLFKTNYNSPKTDLDSWCMSNIGVNEFNASKVGGHYFDTSNYASTWIFNQDNTPSRKDNLLDVYGIARNSSYSDRGAVEYTGATSIKTEAVLKSSKLYPNPNKGLSVNLDNISQNRSFVLYDLNGKQILNGILVEGMNEIDLKNLSQGAYFIVLDKETQALKLIVQ